MNDNAFQFAQPAWILLGLVLVALGLWMFRIADRRRRADLNKLAHPRFQQRLIAGWSPALRWTRRGLWLGAILLLALAAARPQLGYEWREVKRRGIDILFAVDTSQSMLAEDLTPNRLERARLGILDFLNRLGGDRVGLVPFAGSAFALCPLTLDYDAFRESLNTINTDLIPRQGTDLASAIREADRLFDAEGKNQRFLVLITDGEDLQGEAVAAAGDANKNGTTIYTVGVGAADGQLIPVQDRYGRLSYLTDQSGEKVRTKLDEETLRKIAEITGGLYVPLGRGAEGLDAIYQKRLSLAPKSELAQKLEKVPLERFQWPLGAALLLLALQAVLGERKPGRKRKKVVSVARRVRPVAVLAAALLVLASAGAARADVAAYNGGTKAYQNGEFEQAAEQLRNSLKTPDLSLQQKSYYNLGNSLFRIGQRTVQEDAKKTMETWKQAVKAYDDSLALNPDDADAKFNRDFVQRKLDELKQQEEKKNQQNKDQKKDDQKQDKKDQKDQDQKDHDQKDGQQKQDQQGGGQQNQKDQQQDESKDGKSGDKQDGGEPKQDQKDQKKDQPGDKQAGGDEEKKQDEKGESGEEQKPESADKGAQGDEEKKAKPDGDKPGEQKPGMKGQEEKKPGEQKKPSGQAGETRKPNEMGKQGEAAGAAAQQGGERVAGEMSREEAMRLLDSLGGDERIVVPAPLTGGKQGKTTKGKTW